MTITLPNVQAVKQTLNNFITDNPANRGAVVHFNEEGQVQLLDKPPSTDESKNDRATLLAAVSEQLQGTRNYGLASMDSFRQAGTKTTSLTAEEALQLIKDVEKGISATKIQSVIRSVIDRREHITGEKVRALMLEPGKGSAASNNMHSKVAGGKVTFPSHMDEAQFKGEIPGYKAGVEESRDEHRRVLETNVAQEVLSATRPGFNASLDIMNTSETQMKNWIDNKLQVIKDYVENNTDAYNNGELDEPTMDLIDQVGQSYGLVAGLMNALYGHNEPGVFADNHQTTQFTNGIAQATKEGNPLAISSLRCAGMAQCIAWLGDTEPTVQLHNDKCGEVYSNHQFFQGRGRAQNPDANRNKTQFSGIITSNKHVNLVPARHNTEPMTKAQTANVPTHTVSKKPDANADETNVPAWLKEPMARKLPFVNSVSGLGMLTSISDALGLLPANANDKLDFYTFVAAAQLNYVGGHSFYEFMKGAEIGQDVRNNNDSLQTFNGKLTSNTTIKQGDHNINYQQCMERLPAGVFDDAAKAMRNA